MIIFMAGYPFAGKSFVIEEVKKLLPDNLDVAIINPKSYRPEEYDTLTEEDRKEVNIATWECSLDDLRESIENSSNEHVIIYDTSCASYDRMSEFFTMAKERGHKVIYAFVDARIETCEKRAGEKWIGSAIQKYRDSFKVNIPKFAKLSNKAVIINNNDDITRLSVDVNKLVDAIKCLNS